MAQKAGSQITVPGDGVLIVQLVRFAICLEMDLSRFTLPEMSWRRRNGLMIAMVISCALVMMVWRANGPYYHGRSLINWATQYAEAKDGSTEKVKAQYAIRAMPRGRVLSRLVNFATAGADNLHRPKIGGIRNWVIDAAERWNVPNRYSKWLEEQPLDDVAVAGFEAMGTNAAVAIPKLVAMEKDETYELTAVRCLSGIGPPARQFVCAALTNADELVRRWAVYGLPNVFADLEPMFETVKPLLHDTNAAVRQTAIEIVGYQQDAPDLAIPLLCEAIRDGDTSDVRSAGMLLLRFGTNATRGFAALRHVVEQRPASLEASVALSIMVKISPDDAVPELLQRCKLPNPEDRAFAVGLLVHCPNKPSEAMSALRKAALDPNKDVARRALSFWNERYKRLYPNGVPLPEDPTYDGRTLGFWLRQRDGQGEFPT
ncbi:MAG: domain containing protein, partial [Verrucomicrobiales bacterium]|nr:domain containing protein [Verrucomicrobiales bacterium]